MSAATARAVSSAISKCQPLRSCMPLAKSLKIEWDDGYQAEFPYCWLRDATSKRPALVHIDVNMKPEQVKVERSRESLQVQWPSYLYLRFVYIEFAYLLERAPSSCAFLVELCPFMICLFQLFFIIPARFCFALIRGK